jgi:hypothetical protein
MSQKNVRTCEEVWKPVVVQGEVRNFRRPFKIPQIKRRWRFDFHDGIAHEAGPCVIFAT